MFQLKIQTILTPVGRDAFNAKIEAHRAVGKHNGAGNAALLVPHVGIENKCEPIRACGADDPAIVIEVHSIGAIFESNHIRIKDVGELKPDAVLDFVVDSIGTCGTENAVLSWRVVDIEKIGSVEILC